MPSGTPDRSDTSLRAGQHAAGSSPKQRLAAVEALSKAGVPVGVLIAPVIPALNDPRFGSRMRGEGIFAGQISRMFHVASRKVGLPEDGPELSTAAFRRREGRQLGLGL